MSPLLVVGAGPPTRDGGIDLFLELMPAITSRRAADFAWIGGRPRVVARRLDAETAAMGLGDHIVWRAPGTAPSGPGVVHVVTARTVQAARDSLAEAASGVPRFGLAADPAVAEVLRTSGATLIRYPDVDALIDLVIRSVDT